MREELSAHLAGRFEEERGRLGDDVAAAERAIERLGEVSELTRSLQDSVPWLERVLCTPLPPRARRLGTGLRCGVATRRCRHYRGPDHDLDDGHDRRRRSRRVPGGRRRAGPIPWTGRSRWSGPPPPW